MNLRDVLFPQKRGATLRCPVCGCPGLKLKDCLKVYRYDRRGKWRHTHTEQSFECLKCQYAWREEGAR